MNILYIVLIVLALVALGFIAWKFPDSRLFIKILICGAILIFTAYCGIELNRYYTTSGGIYGTISGYFDTNQVKTDTLTFDFTNIELTQDEGKAYSAKVMTNDIFELDQGVTYTMKVNELPCSNVKNGSDYITAEYTYNFYDEQNNLILSDTLQLRFAFYTNSSYMAVQTNGGSEAVKYWNYYFNKNNFNVTIQEATYIPNLDIEMGEGVTPTVCSVTYTVDEKTSQVLVVEGTSISTLTYIPTKDYYQFIGWSLDGQSVVDPSYTISDDVTIYAMFERVAGLYWEDKTLKLSWDDLVSEEVIEVAGTKITSAYHGAYQNSEDLTGALVIEDGIVTIGEKAFSYCYGLTEVYLPESVRHIENGAFIYCENLTYVDFPTNLVTLDSAFVGCNLEEVVIPEGITELDGSFAFNRNLRKVTLSSTVTTISGSFYGDISLTHIQIPNGVERIEGDAFRDCSSLESIYIPSSVIFIEGSYDDIVYDLLSIPFRDCSEHLVIYCESAAPHPNWEPYWNYISETKAAEVKFGYSYDAYLQEI